MSTKWTCAKSVPFFRYAAHPELAAFDAGARSAPWTASYAEEQYGGLSSFLFVDNAGAEHPVRWSLLPTAPVVPFSDDDLAKLGPNHLEQDIGDRAAKAPQLWTMAVTIANGVFESMAGVPSHEEIAPVRHGTGIVHPR